MVDVKKFTEVEFELADVLLKNIIERAQALDVCKMNNGGFFINVSINQYFERINDLSDRIEMLKKCFHE